MRLLDIFDRPMYEFRIIGFLIRAFRKPFSGPYGFHRWGFYGFGVGSVGFMVWTPSKRPPSPEEARKLIFTRWAGVFERLARKR